MLYPFKQTPICIYTGGTPRFCVMSPGRFEMHRPPPGMPTITIRPAYADDESALARLAALDSSVVPTWPQLLVEIDGELRVAMSINDGAVIADPFYPTLELIGLL